MSRQYKSRATQLRAIANEVRRGETSLIKALKYAAICGAAEERDRTLAILKRMSPPGNYCKVDFRNAVCAESILEVLGYTNKESVK